MAWACLQVFTCPGLRIHDYYSQSQLFPRVFHYWGIFLCSASLPLQKAQKHLMYTAEGDLFCKFSEPRRFTCVSWVFHAERNVCGVDFVLNYDLCYVEVACDWSTETCLYSHPVQGVKHPRQFWACCTKATQQLSLWTLVYEGLCWSWCHCVQASLWAWVWGASRPMQLFSSTISNVFFFFVQMLIMFDLG